MSVYEDFFIGIERIEILFYKRLKCVTFLEPISINLIIGIKN
jgi:hypothetical protein